MTGIQFAIALGIAVAVTVAVVGAIVVLQKKKEALRAKVREIQHTRAIDDLRDKQAGADRIINDILNELGRLSAKTTAKLDEKENKHL